MIPPPHFLSLFPLHRILDEATKKVKEEAFYMKRSIDGDDLKGALDHATDMLRELKSSTLNPKTYYELYMKVFEIKHAHIIHAHDSTREF